MPREAWPIWLLSILLLVSFPMINGAYWSEVARTGLLPYDFNLMAPLVGGFMIMFIASPILLGIAWICLRRYNPETRLATWRRDRPVRSILATLVLGGSAAMLLAISIANFVQSSLSSDRFWVGYFVGWVAWLLALRAALIDQRAADELY